MLILFLFFSICPILAGGETFIDHSTQERMIGELVQKHGEQHKQRIECGVEQAAQFWKEEDGGREDFAAFCMENFVSDPAMLDTIFQRIEMFNEAIGGHFTEMSRDIIRPLDLAWGDILPIDMTIGQFNPAAHLNEDLFRSTIAFIVLLNFPNYSLEEKARISPKWERKEWAYANLGDLYISRIPAEILQENTKSMTRAETYINEYNIYMGNLIDDSQKTYFPKDLKLVTHWGIRDELKARYADPAGLQKQEMIYQLMLRIINQEIPEEVINKNEHEWDPVRNKIYKDGRKIPFKSEPDTRYGILLETFKAMKRLDPYFPAFSTHIKRKFELDRKIPYEEVEAMFSDLCSSRQVRDTAKLISKRLGRPLKPFDIWYNGFTGKKSISEEELNKIVAAKYPTLEDFEKDVPNILMKLGFSAEQAKYLAPKIQVDPARGPGHSGGAEIRNAKARLRTRVPKGGMDYKGFNIGMHELGHAAEQTLTLYKMDHYSLRGVPNTAFTEAFAFIFQGRDLEMLGLTDHDKDAVYLKTLDNLWMAYEIMGVALVDMNVWKWMYDHPDATPAQLKSAVISIAKDIWNKYYADVFGVKDQPILAIYSHMIDYTLYLPDYPLGHVMQFQIESYLEGKNLGAEMERMCRIGNIPPQLWMQKAVGSKVLIMPLLEASSDALARLKN